MPTTQETEKIHKLIDFSEIQTMTNYQKRKNGRIAISILTPTQTVHARLIDEDVDSHEKLASSVYSSMLKNVTGDPSHFTIELRHSINKDEKRMCCIYMPSYITPREFEDLSELLDALSQNGVAIYTMVTDFDPRFKKDVPVIKRGPEFEDKEVLEYLTSQNKIIEYSLPFEETRLDIEISTAKQI